MNSSLWIAVLGVWPVITLAQINPPNIYRLELKVKAGIEEKHIIKTTLEKVRNNPLTGKLDALYHIKRFYILRFLRAGKRYNWFIYRLLDGSIRGF